MSPSHADGVDEEVETFASCLKTSNLRKLELTECNNISPVHIATILNGLNGNNSLEELIVESQELVVTNMLMSLKVIPVCVLEGMVVKQAHMSVLSVLSVCHMTPCELVSSISKLHTL